VVGDVLSFRPQKELAGEPQLGTWQEHPFNQ
jgi:hypothetical protein